tara:strand:- start:535 stop:768 length:234 start_codon:yes stop_codon:yes gene_type:complete
MIEIKSKIRKWGNSFGIVVPQQVIGNEKIKEGDEVSVFINKNEDNVLADMFGSLKFSKPTDQLLKEVRKELESKWIK